MGLGVIQDGGAATTHGLVLCTYRSEHIYDSLPGTQGCLHGDNGVTVGRVAGARGSLTGAY